ncbi:Rho GTPase [Hypoxylon texense]
MDGGTVVILPTEQMKTVGKLPEDQLDIFGTLQEQIQAEYTVPDQRVVLDPYHRYLIPSRLTRELDVLTGPMVAALEDGFKSAWGTGPGWTEVNLWQGCFQVVAKAANSALCGAPLCNDEKYLASLEGQSVALFGGSMLISVAPTFLRSITGDLVNLWCAYRARKFAKICVPYIEARIRETRQAKPVGGEPAGSEKPVKDALQLIIDEVISRDDDTQRSASLISDRLLIITNNVSLHSTTLTLHNLISCLVTSDPSLGYIEALREECDEVLRDADGTWNLEAVRKLRLLDSAIRESMRIVPFASIAMARTVADPKGVSIESGQSSVLIPPRHNPRLANGKRPLRRVHLSGWSSLQPVPARDRRNTEDGDRKEEIRDHQTRPRHATPRHPPTTTISSASASVRTRVPAAPPRRARDEDEARLLGVLVDQLSRRRVHQGENPADEPAGDEACPKTDALVRMRRRSV